jgi:hypothetical protein
MASYCWRIVSPLMHLRELQSNISHNKTNFLPTFSAFIVEISMNSYFKITLHVSYKVHEEKKL